MNLKFLFDNLNSRVSITTDDFKIISGYFHFKEFERKEKPVTQGKAHDKVYFIESGLMFNYKTLDSGDLQVIQFAKENYWMGDLYSFFTAAPALFTLEALEDCKV